MYLQVLHPYEKTEVQKQLVKQQKVKKHALDVYQIKIT